MARNILNAIKGSVLGFLIDGHDLNLIGISLPYSWRSMILQEQGYTEVIQCKNAYGDAVVLHVSYDSMDGYGHVFIRGADTKQRPELHVHIQNNNYE